MRALHHNAWTTRIVGCGSFDLIFAPALAVRCMCNLRQWMCSTRWLFAIGRCCHCQSFFVVCKEAVPWTVDIDEALTLREDLGVFLTIWVVRALLPGLVALCAWSDNDDGDGRVLKTVLGHTSGKQALKSTQALASCSDYQNCWLIEIDLVYISDVA